MKVIGRRFGCRRCYVSALAVSVSCSLFGQGIVYVHAPLTNPNGAPNHFIWDSLGTQVGPDFPIIVNGQTVATFVTPQVLGQPSECSIQPAGSNAVIAVQPNVINNPLDPTTFPIPLSAGTIIGPNAAGYQWLGDILGGDILTAARDSETIGEPPITVGYFTGVGSAYIGFDFVQNGQTYYGWIRAGCPLVGLNVGWVYDYAYETNPGVPIVAGAASSESFISSFNGSNQIPANASGHAGIGSFTLEGTTLFYSVFLDVMFRPTSARIYGPSGPDGTSRNVVADLGHYTVTNFPPPLDGPFSDITFPLGAVEYTGSCTLSATEADELRSGRLYVSFTSAAFPRGELRGEILPNVTVRFSPTLTRNGLWPAPNSHNRAEAVIQLTGASVGWQLATDPTLTLKSICFTGPVNFRHMRPVIIPPLSLIGVQIPSGGFTNAPGTPGQILYSGGFNVTDEQAAMLRQGDFSIDLLTSRFPRGEIGSQVVPEDSNRDGVPDYVNDFISLGVPCDAPWKNHSDYVNHVCSLAGQLVTAKEITVRQYMQVLRQAQQSACGKTP